MTHERHETCSKVSSVPVLGCSPRVEAHSHRLLPHDSAIVQFLSAQNGVGRVSRGGGHLLALLFFCQLILPSLAEGGRGRVSASLPTLTKGLANFSRSTPNHPSDRWGGLSHRAHTLDYRPAHFGARALDGQKSCTSTFASVPGIYDALPLIAPRLSLLEKCGLDRNCISPFHLFLCRVKLGGESSSAGVR